MTITPTTTPPVQTGVPVESTEGAGVIDVSQEVKENAPILRGNTVEVTFADGSAFELELPELDELAALMGDLADLEKLIAELTLDNELEQLQASKTRIETKLKELEAKHAETLDKIKEAVEVSQKLADEAKKNKIFGWIMTALSVIATIVTCVSTFGAASPLAIAACTLAVTSCALSLTNQILAETDVLKDFFEEQAEEYKKNHPEVSKKEAMAKVQGDYQLAMTIVSAVIGLASLGCGIASLATNTASAAAKAAELGTKAAETANQGLKFGCKVAQLCMNTIQTAGGIASCVMNWELLFLQKESSEEQAAIAELQALLEMIQAAIDEEQAAMEELLSKIQALMGVISDLLSAGTEASEQILDNMVQTA